MFSEGRESQEGRVLHCEKYPNYNQLIIDISSTQIVAAINKIRTQKGRSDSNKIFRRLLENQLQTLHWRIFSKHYNIWLAIGSC